MAIVSRVKPLKFRADALSALTEFPDPVRREAGFELFQVQSGEEPSDWKPMGTIGSGVSEIRLRDAAGIFRVLYVAKFVEAVYVLHCFQKKTQATDARDIELGRKRFKQLVEERRK